MASVAEDCIAASVAPVTAAARDPNPAIADDIALFVAFAIELAAPFKKDPPVD